MKAFLLPVIGTVFLILAAVGIFVPILPTTPFVLAAAGCFSSCPRVYKWICKSSIFKDYLDNYKLRTGVAKRTKTISIIWLWLALFLSALIYQKLILWCILIVVGAGVTVHIITIGTK